MNQLRVAGRVFFACCCSAALLRCVPAKPQPAAASASPAASQTASSDPEAEALLQKLEQRLLAASVVRVEAKVQITGAVELALSGKMLLKPDNVVSAEFTGSRAGQPLSIFLTSDGKKTKGGPRHHSFEQGTPEGLRRNMLLAFVRKGLTTAIMDLLAGSLPNADEGGVSDRFRLSRLALGSRVPAARRELQAVNFDLLMEDELSAQGTLWIAGDSGLPVQRMLYARRPRELIVIERYEVLQLDAGS